VEYSSCKGPLHTKVVLAALEPWTVTDYGVPLRTYHKFITPLYGPGPTWWYVGSSDGSISGAYSLVQYLKFYY